MHAAHRAPHAEIACAHNAAGYLIYANVTTALPTPAPYLVGSTVAGALVWQVSMLFLTHCCESFVTAHHPPQSPRLLTSYH